MGSLTIQGGGLILGYVAQVAVARWLGDAGFGAYSLVIGWMTTIGTVMALGWPDAFVRFMSTGDGPHAAGILRLGLRSSLAAGMLAVGVGMTLRPDMEPLRSAFSVGLWMIPIYSVGHLFSAKARTARRLVLALAPNSLVRPSLILAGVGAISLVGRPTPVEAVSVAAVATAVGVLWQATALGVGSNPRYQWKRWTRAAAPIWLFTALGVATERADLLIVGAFLTLTDVGAYGAASATAAVVLSASIASEVLGAPRIAEAQDNRQEVIRTTSRLGFWPAAGLFGVFTIFGEDILALFDEDFRRAHIVLIILAAGRLISALAGPVVVVLNVTGHQDENVKAFSIVGVSSVAALLLIVPTFGLVGAACVTAASMVAWNVWLHIVVRRRLHVSTLPF